MRLYQVLALWSASDFREMASSVGLIRQALTDEAGQGDIAYVAIAGLTLAAIGALSFIFLMSAISYINCKPITTISKGDQSVTSVIPCNFDPLPVGQSAGLIFGAFAALIGALAGYMVSTRKQRPAQLGDQNIYAGQVNQVAPQQLPAAPAKPTPQKPKPKGKGAR